jgi:hypothetical protein
MTIKSFGFLSAIITGAVLVVLGLLALSVWAIDSGVLQVTTLAYALPVLLIGLAAAAAHYFYRGTMIARISGAALIVATVIAIVAYAAFRWHSESHRVESTTNKDDGKPPVTPATTPPAPPERKKDRDRRARRKKK